MITQDEFDPRWVHVVGVFVFIIYFGAFALLGHAYNQEIALCEITYAP